MQFLYLCCVFFALLAETFAKGGGGGGSSGGGGGSSGGGGGSKSSGGGSSGGSGGSSGGGSKGGSGSGGKSGGGSSGSGGKSGGAPFVPGGVVVIGASPGSSGYYRPLSSEESLPSDEEIQPVLGAIEYNIIEANNTNKSQVAVSNIVEALLATPTCVPASSSIKSSGVTKTCNSLITPTPTESIPATAFAACTDYASMLRSCASATSSFYSLPASSQVSCACYTRTTSSSRCAYSTVTGSSTFVAPALATSYFDDAADGCYGYLKLQGFEQLASAISGKSSKNETSLGAGMCRNMDEDVQGSDRWGLPRVLDPVSVGECRQVWSSSPPRRIPVVGLFMSALISLFAAAPVY
ncbi:unnamed protein product [Periconia digitata]|uniref:Uncharacterized protein n=1 Tax=Periconia digitata TaxID=1303443 RepID=A0A9W4XVJ3_9PLEO|nr:unnamed protein product [Periconia digitata]